MRAQVRARPRRGPRGGRHERERGGEWLRERRRQYASTSARAVRLLKIVDSEVLQAELDRRKVGSHIFNTEVRPLHAARAAAIDAALAQYGVASPDELAPGPPRKAYDSYARPRDGEPTDDDVISKKAPLIAQQVAFLQSPSGTKSSPGRGPRPFSTK